ncbi:MAG: YrhC family protein [Bacillus sp. (in: firmicutes)]
MENMIKYLTEKMVDYKRFATVLLAVGVFFYLGVIIPAIEKSQMNTEIMMLMTMLCLGASIFFFAKAKKFQQHINEIKDEEN